MKKIIIAAIAILAIGLTNQSKAQDCRSIVGPLIVLRGIDTNTYPAEKLDNYCQFSQNAFFITNQPPANAIVHDISELTNTVTGERVNQDFIADLNTISYWGYNFYNFRPRGEEGPIYFRMGRGRAVQYLAVRSYNEAMARTTHPEEFKD